jgi:hypothetical protein
MLDHRDRLRESTTGKVPVNCAGAEEKRVV